MINLDISDYDLALLIESRLNITFRDLRKAHQGGTIRYVLKTQPKENIIEYFKILKFHYNNGWRKVQRYNKLIGRILRPRNGYSCVIDINELERKIRKKYDIHSHHYDYLKSISGIEDEHLYLYGYNRILTNTVPKYHTRKCKCCKEKYSIEKTSKSKCCSKKCADIMRIHKKLSKKRFLLTGRRNIKYLDNKDYSKSYARYNSKKQYPLLVFVNYLSNQQRIKAIKRNRVNFTWC
ncbi:MAG: hypothetical protein GY829_16175 [Gammaproteobacteria bacterium]|nr:hypothetical protein [Gammaproteobacteria bacterium]